MRGEESRQGQGTCPARAELAAFNRGRLADDAMHAVSAHIETCTRCLAVLDELDEVPDPLDEDLRRIVPEGVTPDEEDALRSTLPQPTTGTAPPERGEDSDGEWPAIPGYEILGKLGRGGMGVVYKARQVGLNRMVALKMIRGGAYADAEDRQRFLREAKAVARLKHPQIVQIHEIGEAGGQPFFSLELVEGGSLAQRLGGTPLPAPAAATLVAALARAMHHAHGRDIIHRDLKPANVLLTDEGTPKITDFGLAKRLDQVGQTHPGAVMGTPSYMAPEQALGQTDRIGAATDVYALGAILYKCLTGRPPFRAATNTETLFQVANDEPVPPTRLNPGCPQDLEAVCLRCLQKRAADRYSTAQLLAEELQRFLDGKPTLARPAGLLERLVKWARRSPSQAAALAGAVAFLLVLLAALVVQVRSVQKDAALLRQEAELQRRELEERRRQDELTTRFTELFSRAEQRAAGAAPGEGAVWTAVQRDMDSALGLVAAEPAFANFPLREPARRLLAQAEGHLADARLRAEQRARLPRLQEHHGDAVVFGTLASGLEQPDSFRRTRRAVAEGLALFGVTTDNDGPPAVDPRFYTPEEVRLIASCCFELLLLDAEALARPRLGGVGEKATEWRGRLRQALALLDRADRLQPGVRTHSGLARRAEYLDLLGEPEAARQARQAADETAPSLAADYFLVGVRHHGQDQWREASRSLVNVLRLQPGHYGAEFVLAVCRLREGRSQDAKVGLSRCLDQRPGFSWPRLLRGYAEMDLGEFAAARADFDAVLRDPPDPAAAYIARVNRGVLALRQRQWDGAAAELEQAIALMPDAVPAYVNLALTRRQQADAIGWQTSLLPLAPRVTFALLAVETRRRQLRLEALAALEEAVRRRPEVARLYHERGRLYLQLDEPGRAREDFARAVALAPNPGAASTLADDLIELGRLLHREKEHAEAVQVYRAVLKVRPEQALAYRLMAEPLLAQKRYPEAGEALDRYLETMPVGVGRPPAREQARRLAEAFQARGLIHVQQKDFRSAIDSYTQGLKLLRNPEVLALRGWAYLLFQAPELALTDFEEALKLRPGYGEALLGRANAQVKRGRVGAALADTEEGLRQAPATPRLLYNAARVYAQAAGQDRDPAWEVRSVDLLREALARVPAGERPAFWRDYVRADSAFDAIRRGKAMRALEAIYGPAGR